MCPEITPDFSEVVELKPGAYRARVIDCEQKEAKKGGFYLRWKLEVVGNDDTRLNGKNFSYMTMITGPGARNFKTFVRATADANYEGGAIDTNKILGSEVNVVLVQGRDQDGSPSDFPEVKSVSKAS